MLKELILDGKNRYYDSEICEGLIVDEADINQFCQQIKMVAINNTIDEAAKKQIKDVTKNVLLSWGVLVEKNGEVFPSMHMHCALPSTSSFIFFASRRHFSFSYLNRGIRTK